MITRNQLRNYLEGQLNKIEDEDVGSIGLADRQLLLRTIDALDALDGGEVYPIFAPAKVRRWGIKPATIRRGRLHAIGCVRLLRDAGFSSNEAILVVGDAFGTSSDAIVKWQNTLGKAKDIESQMIMAMLVSSYRIAPKPWTKKQLLEAVSRAGAEFKKNFVLKKQGK